MDPAVHQATNSRHPWRIWTAITAALALTFAPLIAVSQASADPAGYVGDIEYGTWSDSFLEGRMTAGVYYEAFLNGGDDTTDWEASSLPAGLTLDARAQPVLKISGTPISADGFNFTITGGGETSASIRFSDTIDAATSPTTTTLNTAALAPFDAIALSATVAGNPVVGGVNPTGSVEFYAGSTLIATSTIDGNGVATATGTLPSTSVGTTQNITAKYLGDTGYATSTSSAVSVLIYAATVKGILLTNGQPVSGTTVELRGSALEIVQASTVTSGTGEFTLSPGAIITTTDANKTYVIRASFPGGPNLYYANGSHDVTASGSATLVSPTSWGSSLTIEHHIAPVWDDTGLSVPRVGSSYSDAVSATSPNAVAYTVSAGLPGGLGLNGSSGAVTGTPTGCSGAACDYAFTITADNGYGSIQKSFSGTVLPVGLAPTWTDELLPDLQVSIPVDDGVTAAGDPTIVYALSAGTLPNGLTLSTTDGAVTGTPTTTGAYSFSITATNGFGSIQADFTGTIAAAPVIDLTLDFAPGTTVTDATSTISASGLKVGSDYTLTMFSTPVVLYTGVIGPGGGFTWTVSLPAGTPPGAHRLLLTGVAPDGSSMSAQAWFTLLPNGTIGAISYSGPLSYTALTSTALARTGTDLVLPLGLGGGLFALGALALLSDRRRATR